MQSSRGNGLDIEDFYVVGGPLSATAFGNGGEVLRCTRIEDGCSFAVKKIVKCTSMEDESQIQAMLRVDHAGIIKLIDWFEDEETLYIVMELAQGGDLCERIIEQCCFSENEAATVFHQILSAVCHMHGKGIVHADIKPENILFESAHTHTIKVADFGSARIIEEGEPIAARCGTLAYTAPEILEQRDFNCGADMWSLGVLLYTMLAGFTPFGQPSNGSRHRMAMRIKKCDLDFSDAAFNTVSAAAIDLIRELLVCDPARRLTAAQALQHRWFAEHVADAVYTDNNNGNGQLIR